MVIPAWGAYAGAPLQEALASLREQDAPARIIVVDNASEEPLGPLGDAEVLRAPERLTVGAARNLGLDHVTTPYVLFWDADDLMLPGTLRFLLERIQADSRWLPSRRRRGGIRDPAPLAAALERPARAPPPLFALGHSVWSLFPSTGATIMRTALVRDAVATTPAEAAETGCWEHRWPSGADRRRDRPGRVYRRLGESLWQENMAPARQLANAAAVRERLRTDPAIPGWARASRSL